MWLFRDFGVLNFTIYFRELLPWLLQLLISKTLKWSLCFWYPKWNLASDLAMQSSLCCWSWYFPSMTNTHTLHSTCTSALSLLVFMRLLCCIFPKYFWCPSGTLYLYSSHHHCCTCHQWQAYTACKTCQQSPPLALMAIQAPTCIRMRLSSLKPSSLLYLPSMTSIRCL